MVGLRPTLTPTFKKTRSLIKPSRIKSYLYYRSAPLYIHFNPSEEACISLNLLLGFTTLFDLVVRVSITAGVGDCATLHWLSLLGTGDVAGLALVVDVVVVGEEALRFLVGWPLGVGVGEAVVAVGADVEALRFLFVVGGGGCGRASDIGAREVEVEGLVVMVLSPATTEGEAPEGFLIAPIIGVAVVKPEPGERNPTPALPLPSEALLVRSTTLVLLPLPCALPAFSKPLTLALPSFPLSPPPAVVPSTIVGLNPLRTNPGIQFPNPFVLCLSSGTPTTSFWYWVQLQIVVWEPRWVLPVPEPACL